MNGAIANIITNLPILPVLASPTVITMLTTIRNHRVSVNRIHRYIHKDGKLNPNPTNPTMIRLSKRMAELGIASRREATRLLKEASECQGSIQHLSQVIYLRGKPVIEGTAVKVPTDEEYIEVKSGRDFSAESGAPPALKKFVAYQDRKWEEISGDSIILNKPVGYVSGQEEHQHVPAVRLLTRDNRCIGSDDEAKETLGKEDDGLHFSRKKWKHVDSMTSSIPKRVRSSLSKLELEGEEGKGKATLSGYAPVGRLDINSTGLLVFSRAGVMARRLISPATPVEKEYIITVEPALGPSKLEIADGLSELPKPTTDLSVLFRKGNRLWNDTALLKPVVKAEWLHKDKDAKWPRKMRLVIKQGRKRQVRRMARELLGLHVLKLERTSVGAIRLGDLPEGKWRPLRREEVQAIFADPQSKQKEAAKKSNR